MSDGVGLMIGLCVAAALLVKTVPGAYRALMTLRGVR